MPRVSTLITIACDGLESPTSEPSDEIWQLLASPQLLAGSGDVSGDTVAGPAAVRSLAAAGLPAARGADADAIRTPLAPPLFQCPPLGRPASPQPLADSGAVFGAAGAVPSAPRAGAAAGPPAARDADADAIRTPFAAPPPQRPPLGRPASPQPLVDAGAVFGAARAVPSAPRAGAAARPPAARDADAGAVRTPLAALPPQFSHVGRPSRGQLLQAAASSTAHCAPPQRASRRAEDEPGGPTGVPPAVAEYALRRAWHAARNGTPSTESARMARGPEAVLDSDRAACAPLRLPAARSEHALHGVPKGGRRESCPSSRGMLIYCSIMPSASMGGVLCTPRTVSASSLHVGRDGNAAKRPRAPATSG